MNEPTALDDIRAAKQWADAQSTGLDEMADRLRAIERDFQARTGEYADVPHERPEWLNREIANALAIPGEALLGETRSK